MLRNTLILLSITVGFCGGAVASDMTDITLAELQQQLAQVEREYELEPTLELIERVQAFVENRPSVPAYLIYARAALFAAELRRFEYEEKKNEWDPRDRRLYGNEIDDVTNIGHAALDNVPDELSEKWRIKADLYATMIRTKARGSLYKGRMERAQEKALKLDPQNPRALVTAAKRPLFAEERHGGDPEEALRLLNKALQIDPEMERAIVFRGIAYEKLGLPEKATAEFDRALEINPNSQLAQKKMNAIFPEEFVVDE